MSDSFTRSTFTPSVKSAGGETVASDAHSHATQQSPGPRSTVTPHRKMVARDETNFYLERRLSIARAVKELEEERPDQTTSTPLAETETVPAEAIVEEERVTATRIGQFLESAAKMRKRISPTGGVQNLRELFTATRKSKSSTGVDRAMMFVDRSKVQESNENDRLTINTMEREMDVIETTVAASEETDEETELLWRRMSTRERQIAIRAYRHEHTWQPKHTLDKGKMTTNENAAPDQQAKSMSTQNPIGLGITIGANSTSSFSPEGKDEYRADYRSPSEASEWRSPQCTTLQSSRSGSTTLNAQSSSLVRQQSEDTGIRKQSNGPDGQMSMIEFFQASPQASSMPTLPEASKLGLSSRAGDRNTIRACGKRMVLRKAIESQRTPPQAAESEDGADWETITSESASCEDETYALGKPNNERTKDCPRGTSDSRVHSPMSPDTYTYLDQGDPFMTSALQSPTSSSARPDRGRRPFHEPPVIDYKSQSELIVKAHPSSPDMPFTKHEFLDPKAVSSPTSPDEPGWVEAVAYARNSVIADKAEEEAVIERAPLEFKDAAKAKAKQNGLRRTKESLGRILERQSIFGWSLKKPLEKLTDIEHEMYCDTLLASDEDATRAFKLSFFEKTEWRRRAASRATSRAASRLNDNTPSAEQGRNTDSVGDFARTPTQQPWTPPLRMGKIKFPSPLVKEVTETETVDTNTQQIPEKAGSSDQLDAHNQSAASTPKDQTGSDEALPFRRQQAIEMVERSLNPRFSIHLGDFGSNVAEYLTEQGSPVPSLASRRQRRAGFVASSSTVAAEDKESPRFSTQSTYADGLPKIPEHTPIIKARPDSTQDAASPTGSFHPRKRDTFYQKLSAERAKKLAQIGVHPAMASAGHPGTTGSPSRVAMPPFSAQEVERIGYMEEGEKVRARLDAVKLASNQGSPSSPQQPFFTAPLAQGEWAPQTPVAPVDQEESVSIDEVTKLWETVRTRTPFERMLDALDNDFRAEMGLQRILVTKQRGNHPNHPFPWHTTALKCMDRHSESSSDDSAACITCGVLCCLYAEARQMGGVDGDVLSENLAAESDREKMGQIIDRFPDGDMRGVLLPCSRCELLNCPEHCDRNPGGTVVCHECLGYGFTAMI
ncbi:hypothetical protein MBLNU230_g1845t1 [Neophaeotheca triangularis]